MQSAIDQAITAASSAEATYQADLNSVSTIQANIAAATSPLAPAQAQLATDQSAYVAALQTLDQAIQAEITALSTPA